MVRLGPVTEEEFAEMQREEELVKKMKPKPFERIMAGLIIGPFAAVILMAMWAAAYKICMALYGWAV